MIPLPMRGTAACIEYAREKGWLTSESAKYTIPKSYTTHKILPILRSGQRIQECGRQLSLAQSKDFSEQAYIHRNAALVRKNIETGNPAFFTKHRIPGYSHICIDEDYIATATDNVIRIWKFTLSDTIVCQTTIGNVNDTGTTINNLRMKNGILVHNREIGDEIKIQKVMIFDIQSGKEFELKQAAEKLSPLPCIPIAFRNIILLRDRIFFIREQIKNNPFESKTILHSWKTTGEFIESIDTKILISNPDEYEADCLCYNEKYIVMSSTGKKNLFIYNIQTKITLFVNLPFNSNEIHSTHFFEDRLICGLESSFITNNIPSIASVSSFNIKKIPSNAISFDLRTGAIIRYYHNIYSLTGLVHTYQTTIVDNCLYASYRKNKLCCLSVTNLSNNNIEIIDRDEKDLISFKVDGPLLLGQYGHSLYKTNIILKIWDRQSLKLLNQISLPDHSHIALKAGKVCVISPEEHLDEILAGTAKIQEIIQIDYATTREKKEESHLPLPENSGWLDTHTNWNPNPNAHDLLPDDHDH